MNAQSNDDGTAVSIEQRRIQIEEEKLKLERSFAKKWFPTLVTLTVAFVAGVFGYIQQRTSADATDRATIETTSRNEREWGFKAIELYVTKWEQFDISKNPERAAKNLQALAAVAPIVVQGLLNAELSKVPAPTGSETDNSRISALESAATVQMALAAAQQPKTNATSTIASSFTIYLQYPEGKRELAEKVQRILLDSGYKVPGMEEVKNVPQRLEVRYYLPDQKTIAETLANRVGTAISQPSEKTSAKMLRSSKPLPSGIMEIWLPK